VPPDFVGDYFQDSGGGDSGSSPRRNMAGTCPNHSFRKFLAGGNRYHDEKPNRLWPDSFYGSALCGDGRAMETTVLSVKSAGGHH